MDIKLNAEDYKGIAKQLVNSQITNEVAKYYAKIEPELDRIIKDRINRYITNNLTKKVYDAAEREFHKRRDNKDFRLSIARELAERIISDSNLLSRVSSDVSEQIIEVIRDS